MTQRNFRTRFVFPVFFVFAIALISFIAYFGSRHLSHHGLHMAIAGIFGTTYFVAIAFGTLYVFTRSYLAGARLPERILASFINPFLWMTKEVFRLTASHPFSEALYWYFNPLNVWLICLMVLEMGVATLIARSILKRDDPSMKVATLAPFAAIFGSLFLVISLYAWGQGENIYVIFLKGYRLLFGSGT